MFLSLTWSDVFYSILSIIMGLILIIFAISQLVKKNKKLFPIVVIIHGLLFLGFGILGFFVPEKYNFITILAIVAFGITLILSFLTIGKKDKLTN